MNKIYNSLRVYSVGQLRTQQKTGDARPKLQKLAQDMFAQDLLGRNLFREAVLNVPSLMDDAISARVSLHSTEKAVAVFRTLFMDASKLVKRALVTRQSQEGTEDEEKETDQEKRPELKAVAKTTSVLYGQPSPTKLGKTESAPASTSGTFAALDAEKMEKRTVKRLKRWWAHKNQGESSENYEHGGMSTSTRWASKRGSSSTWMTAQASETISAYTNTGLGGGLPQWEARWKAAAAMTPTVALDFSFSNDGHVQCRFELDEQPMPRGSSIEELLHLLHHDDSERPDWLTRGNFEGAVQEVTSERADSSGAQHEG